MNTHQRTPTFPTPGEDMSGPVAPRHALGLGAPQAHDTVLARTRPAGHVDQRLYPLPELALRPWMPRKHGRPVHISTLLRWALKGRRGVRLHTLMVGGCRCTCDAWAFEFFERLTSDPEPDAPPSVHERGQQLSRAEKQLEEAGL